MTRNQTKAIKAMRDTLHLYCKSMKPDEYKTVLEEVLVDIKANLEAVIEESEDEED